MYWAISFDLRFKRETPPGVLNLFYARKTRETKDGDVLYRPEGLSQGLQSHLAHCLTSTSHIHGSWRIRQFRTLSDGSYHFASLASMPNPNRELTVRVLRELYDWLALPDYRVLVRMLASDHLVEEVCWYDPIQDDFVWEPGWIYQSKLDPNHPVNHGKVHIEGGRVQPRKGDLLFFQPTMDIRELRQIHSTPVAERVQQRQLPKPGDSP